MSHVHSHYITEVSGCSHFTITVDTKFPASPIDMALENNQ